MSVFYSIIGSIDIIIAIMMLRCVNLASESQPEFKTACRVLYIVMVLIGVSTIIAQFEPRLENGEFQKLNPLMLEFFYIVSQGLIYSLLILFRAKYTNQYLKSTLPMLIMFVIYSIAYFILDDPFIYSFDVFFDKLLHTPMLIFRCVLLIALMASILYGVIKCQKAYRENNIKLTLTFTEDEFNRSVVITKYMWSIIALSMWTVLPFFYTSSPFEVASCILVTFILGLQYLSIRKYLLDCQSVPDAIEIESSEERIKEEDIECLDLELKKRLNTWIAKEDKPFMRNSIAITDVAREIGVPKNRLSAHINVVEVNFRTWINNLRIEESKRLLTTRRDLSISDIAQLSGFCDLPAFSRAFKKSVGITPKAFRNNESANA